MNLGALSETGLNFCFLAINLTGQPCQTIEWHPHVLQSGPPPSFTSYRNSIKQLAMPLLFTGSYLARMNRITCRSTF